MHRTGASPERVTRTYGRGSLLGLLSPLLSFFMASRGMNGWQQSAIRDMEKDALDMDRRGYRIVSTQESTMPVFGIAYYTVIYERRVPQP
jgi:hypothetical protein